VVKVKFFFWLALHRRLWTAEYRKRHAFSKKRSVCSVISRTRPPTTCCPPTYSLMRFGTDCCLGWGCSTWCRLMILVYQSGGRTWEQPLWSPSSVALTHLCCLSLGRSGRNTIGEHSTASRERRHNCSHLFWRRRMLGSPRAFAASRRWSF
jgi:hypothetical protein